GEFDDTPLNNSFTPTSTTPFTLAIRATDAGGHSAVLTREIHPVSDNLPPVASIIATPGQPLAGHAVSLRASGTDVDGDTVNYAWDLDGDGQFDDATGAYATVTAPAGGLRVALRATDGEGASTIVHAVYETGGVPPVASFDVSKPEPVEGDTVTLTSTATDADDAIVAQKWDLDDDGAFDDASGTSAQLSLPVAGDV